MTGFFAVGNFQFFVAKVCRILNTSGMSTELSPQQLLQHITQIPHMERGKLRVMRQGPSGPYYHLQSWEAGKNFNRYVPREQLPAVRLALAGYQSFQQLTEQYAAHVIAQTRAELAGSKKKPPPRNSSWPKTRKSSS
jgi:hypothetical protein